MFNFFINYKYNVYAFFKIFQFKVLKSLGMFDISPKDILTYLRKKSLTFFFKCGYSRLWVNPTVVWNSIWSKSTPPLISSLSFSPPLNPLSSFHFFLAISPLSKRFPVSSIIFLVTVYLFKETSLIYMYVKYSKTELDTKWEWYSRNLCMVYIIHIERNVIVVNIILIMFL